MDPKTVYMKEALKEARKAFEADEVPVGAVIVHRNQIVARAHNQVELLNDPTAHAEMIAITQAANTLSVKWLYECAMYVTLEPCSMCAGASVLARLDRIYFGADDAKSGACGSILNITDDYQLNHRVIVTGGHIGEECGTLLTSFFEKKRARKKA